MADNLIVTTGAATGVPNEISSFQGGAFGAIDEARAALDLMASTRPVFPAGTATPGTATGNITYNAPTNKPSWTFTFDPPTWNIADPILAPVSKETVVDFTGEAPAAASPNLPVRPNPTPVSEPGDSPTVTSVVIPDAPALSTIADPTEWAINIPLPPTIVLPTFDSVKPSTAGIAKPSANFVWNEDPYTSQTLTEIETQISRYFAGGTGIPDVVWEAIWAKDNDKENRAGNKQITETNEEWSSRGFQLPQGVQAAQIAEIRQELQSSSISRARDIAIQEATLEIENLKFAVQQGIALESLRGSWHQATIARLLEATKYSSELAISVFNAELSFYNAEVQMYLADLQVYQAELQAQLTELEVYKSDLEGQKIIGELNQQQVAIYTAKVQALNLEIDRYNSVLEGVKTTVEVDAVRIEAYKSEVQAFSERIKAVNTEYEGYATAMEGAKLEVDMYASNVSAYASTVQAYSTKVNASAVNSNIDIDINKYKLEEYNLKVQSFIAELDAEVKNLQAASESFNADNKAYLAEIESETAQMNAQSTKYNADIQLASQTTQVNIANAETNAKNALAEAGIIQQGLDAIAKVNGAYAGSALAAINVGMSISDSAGNSASA